MFVGTGSDVGKSVINTAFCRIFLQDGYNPAPFKAQNMSLNSYATIEGLEIGRAQAVQAEACGIQGSVDMNPVLLKPTGNLSSQVVLHGRPTGNESATEYFNETNREGLFLEAMKAYNRLKEKYSPIVIEGAGSISEVNLRDKDIANMRVARQSGAATYLVADIDKGGVFGSVFGTLELLPPEERDLIKGIIINKFRGDIRLFKKGRKMLEKLCKKPVVGLVPFYRDIYIDQEDSVVIKSGTRAEGKINVAVVLLKHMSNFTDFEMIQHLPGVHLYYTEEPHQIQMSDMVIIPGTKNTIADLIHIRDTGLADSILKSHKEGKPVYGICGGYQMMGRDIKDPLHVEGNVEAVRGLDILPVSTTLSAEKRTVQCEFKFLDEHEICHGYEIHMGETLPEKYSPLTQIRGNGEGYYLNPLTWGTYVHGIFDNSTVVQHVLRQVDPDYTVKMDFRNFKEENYNKLADLVREAVDMDYIYKSMGIYK